MADLQKTMESLTLEQQQAIRAAFEEMGKLDRIQKYERFRRLNKFVRPHQILFVGSSLMEQFPIYELLLDRQLPWTIYNRGVGGSTSFDLMEHMEECVYELQPDYTEEGLISRYRRIIQDIRLHLPEARLFMLAYYPVNPAAAESNPGMKEALRVRLSDPAVIVYFRKPDTIWASASSSVRPKVISFIICSPAILPMAASWIRLASKWLAVSSGTAVTHP